MKSEWLQHTVLRAASLLAPGDQRTEWFREWHSELWYVPRRGAARFCLGAFRDAIWLRRNNLSPAVGARIHLDSPLACLAFLATLAAVSMLVAVSLSGPLKHTRYWHLRARDLPAGCAVMLMYSCVFLAATRLTMGRALAARHSTSWPSRLRQGIFLVLKVALIQPTILCGFLVMVLIAPAIPIAPPALIGTWILAFRWVLMDQRQRCPVCLRLLTNPVRIGTPSETFLEGYGAESVCSRGHGLLFISEISASYSRNSQWLRLGDSWSGLFPAASSGRQS